MQPGRAVEMTDAGKTKENQTQVSLRFPRPLEIAARFPHSHRPGEARKSGKRKPRFPLSPWRLLQLQNQSRKETRPRIAPLPPSGSFFNEKMLLCQDKFCHFMRTIIQRVTEARVECEGRVTGSI